MEKLLCDWKKPFIQHTDVLWQAQRDSVERSAEPAFKKSHQMDQRMFLTVPLLLLLLTLAELEKVIPFSKSSVYGKHAEIRRRRFSDLNAFCFARQKLLLKGWDGEKDADLISLIHFVNLLTAQLWTFLL